MTEFARRGTAADSGLNRAGVANRLYALDLSVVKAAARSTKSPMAKTCAVAFTKLGNGWIYPVIMAAIFLRWGYSGLRILVAVVATNGILHALYPRMKRYFSRARPYVIDTNLKCLAAPLDKYSFPSGHTMTLTGVFVPIDIFWHAALPSSIVLGFCLAWSRLATAHHYPSDVLAGTLLGIGVGLPITAMVTWVW